MGRNNSIAGEGTRALSSMLRTSHRQVTQLESEASTLRAALAAETQRAESLEGGIAMAKASAKRRGAERDKLAAHCGVILHAISRAYEGATRQLAEPRSHADDQYALTAIATTCEAALAATPAQSLEAHDRRVKAETLREAARELSGGGCEENHGNQLMEMADRLAAGEGGKDASGEGFRIAGGKLTMWFAMIRVDELLAAEFEKARLAVVEATKTEVVLGEA